MADSEKLISRKELKTNLITALKNSGALNSVKAQLRKEFIEGISKSHSLPKTTNNDISLKSRILYSIVYHFLRSRHLLHSASVYAAETGLDATSILSERDVVNGLSLGTSTSIYKAVNSALTSELPVSVFEQLIDESCARFRVTSMTTCTQTDISGPGVREALETQMKEIRVSYLHRREAERLLPTKTIEERMIAYQRECEERFRKDLDLQVQHIRDVEVAKVRAAEQQRLHLELNHQQQALEAEYQRKLQAQSEREKETVRLFSEKERQLQQLQYETRQQMQREMDDLRHREQMMKRKCDLEQQGLKVLEGRLKELQINLEAREREVSRRERDAAIKFDDELNHCRKEAEAAVQHELDRLQGERIQIEMEKKRCNEQSKMVESYQSEIVDLRNTVRDLKITVSNNEDEILTLRHQLTLAQRAMTLENADTADLLRGIGVEEDVTKGSRVDQIICLIRRNVEVEARVLQLDGYVAKATDELKHEREIRQSMEEELESLQQELQATKILLRERTDSVSESEKALRTELDKLKKELSDEKVKASLVNYECQQLEKLLHEQRLTIANMRKRNVLRKTQDTSDVVEPRQHRARRHQDAPYDYHRPQYSDETRASVQHQVLSAKSDSSDIRSSYKENIHTENQPVLDRLEDVPSSHTRPPVYQTSQQSYALQSGTQNSYGQPTWQSQASPVTVQSFVPSSTATSEQMPARSLTISPQTISPPSSSLTSAQISPVYRSESTSLQDDIAAREAAAKDDRVRADLREQSELEARRIADEKRATEQKELRLQEERAEQQKRDALEAARRQEDELRAKRIRDEQAIVDAQRKREQEELERKERERLDAQRREHEQEQLRQKQIEEDERQKRELQTKLKADAEEAQRREEEAAEREKQAQREREAREAQERILAEAEQRRKDIEAKKREAELERERELEEQRLEKEREAKAREDAATAAAREKELEEQRKKEEDAKAIQSAREKILARRQQKQQRENALPPAPEPEPAPFVATVNDNDISEIETFEAQSISESSRDSSEW